ncbi:rhodanese-like domain-containing protein [Vallicoccus soli]|uniref:Rhodanese-like domain-containing protein n=2 Tax=Vallicoccus soli TaxID=2339232 RepID=A0A3A3YZM7_9ACTN|nr:rhodanese-like domain-containing protein [Vallicoccus soli]
MEPAAAPDAVAAGALLVDIRPVGQRAEHGEVPGALVVDRNVLEWRLDPQGSARLPVASYDRTVVVLCQEGYSSSLAAADLLELGVPATDVVGGYAAWRAAGLPVAGAPAGGDAAAGDAGERGVTAPR